MKKPILMLTLSIVSLLFILTPAFFAWRGFVHAKRQRDILRRIEVHCDEGRFREAFGLIQSLPKTASDESFEARLRHWDILCCVQLREFSRLVWNDRESPSLVRTNEEASLLVARAYLQAGDKAAYQEVRQAWKAQLDKPSWVMLEVDRHLLEDRRDLALAILQQHQFPEKSDCQRLVRLALLHAEQPTTAWLYLDQAANLDPANGDVRLFRAQLLESTGELQQARVEYVAAHVAEPRNLLYRDRLGEYYRRRGQFELAIETWVVPNATDADDMRLKSVFWSRVATPASTSELKSSFSDSPWDCVSRAVAELPAGTYWTRTLSEQIENQQPRLHERPETQWLRILQALREARENDALQQLVQAADSIRLWADPSANELVRVLRFRVEGRLDNPGFRVVDSTRARDADARHPLLVALSESNEESQLSSAIRAVLQGKNALAALFLAFGWPESAIQFFDASEVSAADPEWLSYGMVQAYRRTRGLPTAIQVARQLPETQPLRLLIAEMKLAAGDAPYALPRLKALQQGQGDVAFRATWLLAGFLLDQGKPLEARTALQSHPGFLQSTAGRILLARSYEIAGEPERAAACWTQLSDDSFAGQAWRARQAFQAGQWREAERITLQLLDELPDHLQLLANLNAIREAEDAP